MEYTPPTVNDSEYIAGVKEDHDAAMVAADQLLREICDANRQPSYAELVHFNREVGWGEPAVASELRRMRNVLKNEAIAGTPADRDAAKKEAIEAAEVLKTRGRKLREDIDKLEAKLRAVETDAKLTADRVEAQSQAVVSLRALAPKYISHEYRAAKDALNGTLRRVLLDKQTRANELRNVLDDSLHPNEQHYIAAVKRFSFHAVRPNPLKAGFYELTPQWASERDAAAQELAELEPEIESLESTWTTERARLDAMLDYYAQ